MLSTIIYLFFDKFLIPYKYIYFNPLKFLLNGSANIFELLSQRLSFELLTTQRSVPYNIAGFTIVQ